MNKPGRNEENRMDYFLAWSHDTTEKRESTFTSELLELFSTTVAQD